jgi:hypothetical protein
MSVSSWARTVGGGGGFVRENEEIFNRSVQVARSCQTSRFSRPHVRPGVDWEGEDKPIRYSIWYCGQVRIYR